MIPFFVRYGRYMYNSDCQGRFSAISYATGEPVDYYAVWNATPVTIRISSVLHGDDDIDGLASGDHLRGKTVFAFLDNISVTVGLIAVSMPNFWLGLVLILIFFPESALVAGDRFLWLAILDSAGNDRGISQMRRVFMRTTRSAMLECIRQDYVDTARAKGQN